MKQAFIIHGWDGYHDEGWFPWLKTELEKNSFQVKIPAIPEKRLLLPKNNDQRKYIF